MEMEKYLNPFTDFGFKKLFGSEPNKELLIDFLNQLLPPHHQIQDLTYVRNEQLGDTRLDRGAVFDKWLYVLKHLPRLTARPAKLQERIFSRLLAAAEIGQFNREELAEYENSLKHYRDMKNVVDTAKVEGRAEGKVEGRNEKAIEVARKGLKRNMPLADIADLTGLSEAEIAALQQ